MRFATCPACSRLVSLDAAGRLQGHDVPYPKRQNPKVPEACAMRSLHGQSSLEA